MPEAGRRVYVDVRITTPDWPLVPFEMTAFEDSERLVERGALLSVFVDSHEGGRSEFAVLVLRCCNLSHSGGYGLFRDESLSLRQIKPLLDHRRHQPNAPYGNSLGGVRLAIRFGGEDAAQPVREPSSDPPPETHCGPRCVRLDAVAIASAAPR
jgi:hypothetical protein